MAANEPLFPIPPPRLTRLDDILPAEPMLLMGAGPVPIPHAVARANGVIINHLGETMARVIDSLKGMARYAFQTRADKVFGVAGPASAAMEMAVTNLLWPTRKCLCLKTGTFSGRLAEMALAVGADVTVLEANTAEPITADQVAQALRKGRYDVVTLVHGETSCGVLNRELPQIAALVREHGALTLVDAVVTLSTLPLEMDAWNLDAVVTGGQKGLSSIPGVSMIAFSDRAWKAIESRPVRATHWCLDAIRAQRFWGEHQYHYTAPVPGILALHEALRLVSEEGLPQRHERHRISSESLQEGLEAMGLELFVPKANRLNSVIAVRVPPSTSAHDVLAYMSRKFHVEISGSLGLDVVRLGQMGEQCRSHNLFKVLYATGMSFRHFGVQLDVSQGLAALERALSRRQYEFE
ncbi:MAG TPA: alanine--glyoxylate aminotransferase family protein [Polyangiaceae bacterium]|jgi:aspartate aminotransferase-like enzyme|nr:alanine--glyoxylate aminotransferase family protein [Polyangiaceae bacterium]